MRDEEIDADETTGELHGPERRTDPAELDDAVTMYPCPPLFLKEDETADERPLAAEIKTVIVHRRRGIKDLPYLGWKTIEELWEAEDLLREYGQGTYILYGRGLDRRNNIRVTTLTVGDPDERKAAIVAPRPSKGNEIDFAKVIGAISAAAAPFVAIFQDAARERREEARRERDRDDERRREERERDQTRHNEQMEFIAKLAAARNEDLVTILKTQAERTSTSGSASDYQQGQADMVALMTEMRESGMGKEDPENKLIDLLGSLVAGGRLGKDQAEALKRTMQAQANGEGGGQ